MDDALIVAMYVVIDDTMTALGLRGHYLACLSDAEVLTVAVFAALYVGNHRARAVGQFAGGTYFPRVLSPSRFNRCLHALADWLELFLETLGDWIARGQAAICAVVVDSLPTPVCRQARARRCCTIRRHASCGYCPTKKEKYFGWHLHLVCTTDGVPVACALLPAGCHNLTPLHELLYGLPPEGPMGGQVRAKDAVPVLDVGHAPIQPRLDLAALIQHLPQVTLGTPAQVDRAQRLLHSCPSVARCGTRAQSPLPGQLQRRHPAFAIYGDGTLGRPDYPALHIDQIEVGRVARPPVHLILGNHPLVGGYQPHHGVDRAQTDLSLPHLFQTAPDAPVVRVSRHQQRQDVPLQPRVNARGGLRWPEGVRQRLLAARQPSVQGLPRHSHDATKRRHDAILPRVGQQIADLLHPLTHPIRSRSVISMCVPHGVLPGCDDRWWYTDHTS